MKMEVELKINKELEDILLKEDLKEDNLLLLHSNKLGCTIGEIQILEIK